MTMITPSYLGETIEYSSLHACRSTLEDPTGLSLLHDAERQEWALWFQAQGVADAGHGAASGISFDDQMLLIRAAASDQGIALVTETLARPELDKGTLVRVLNVAWPQEFSYWLVSPRATAEQPKIVAFRDWLLSEGRRISDSVRSAAKRGRARKGV